MKYIKPISIAIAVLIVIGLGFKFYKWINPTTHTATVVTPTDTSFSSVTHDTYRPQSIPFIERTQKPPAHLPDNIKPSDVKEVITVVKSPKDTTQVIITKKGDVYVGKQGGKVEAVTVTTYEPPILSWDLFIKIGVDGTTEKISPVAAIGLCEIIGRVDVPVFSLDLQGVGIGADVKIFKPISVGILYHDSWQTDKSIRLIINYNF